VTKRLVTECGVIEQSASHWTYSEYTLKKRDWRYIRELAYYSSLGLQVALSILIGYAIGLYLDSKLDSKPWLTVIFFILGVAAAYRNIALAIKKLRDF